MRFRDIILHKVSKFLAVFIFSFFITSLNLYSSPKSSGLATYINNVSKIRHIVSLFKASKYNIHQYRTPTISLMQKTTAFVASVSKAVKSKPKGLQLIAQMVSHRFLQKKRSKNMVIQKSSSVHKLEAWFRDKSCVTRNGDQNWTNSVHKPSKSRVGRLLKMRARGACFISDPALPLISHQQSKSYRYADSPNAWYSQVFVFYPQEAGRTQSFFGDSTHHTGFSKRIEREDISSRGVAYGAGRFNLAIYFMSLKVQSQFTISQYNNLKKKGATNVINYALVSAHTSAKSLLNKPLGKNRGESQGQNQATRLDNSTKYGIFRANFDVIKAQKPPILGQITAKV